MVNAVQNRWAFLVGINRYQDRAYVDLKYCVNDVTELQRVLQSVGYTVVFLHDEQGPRVPRFPTHKNIVDELKQLCRQVGPDDLLLVYFAGHGVRAADGKPRLIAEDTRAYEVEKQAIAVADIEAWMKASDATRLIMMLDACHMGLGTDQRAVDSEFVRNVYELAEGFALLVASTAQQGAHELGGLGHGLFSYYVLKGLAGEALQPELGFVTVGSLQRYVLNELKKQVVAEGFVQQPMGRAEGDLGDMILVDWRGKEPSELKAVLSEQATARKAIPVVKPLPPRKKKLDTADVMKLARLDRQLKQKRAQHERESEQLDGASGAAEVQIEQTLVCLEKDIARIDAQRQEVLNA